MTKLEKALELRKAKYLRRTGTSGNYKYIYKEGVKRKGNTNVIFPAGTFVRIVSSGSKATPTFSIITQDGSALHSMFFDSKQAAQQYADKKGFNTGTKSAKDIATSIDKINVDRTVGKTVTIAGGTRAKIGDIVTLQIDSNVRDKGMTNLTDGIAKIVGKHYSGAVVVTDSKGEQGLVLPKNLSAAKQFSLDPKKIQSIKMPKALKEKWKKNGGLSNPEYQAWVKENWASDPESLKEKK